MHQSNFNKNYLVSTMLIGIALSLSACSDSSNGNSTTSVTKPTIPAGVGSEFVVKIPVVNAPLPAVENASSNGERALNDNTVAYLLKGINNIWKGTSDTYQQASSGNGPDEFLENPIVDARAWRENIEYVINVTKNRTDDAAILAFLDDRRSKNYSVIDGFGPLTSDYVTASGAYVELPGISKHDVLEDAHYNAAHNDDSKYMGAATVYVDDGKADTPNEIKPLTPVADLVYLFRENSPASTSSSKYLFSTPRPWRMTNTGVVEFTGTTGYSYNCMMEDDVLTAKNYDQYISDVVVIPGLMCARREHSKSKDDAGKLFTSTTENRRKDGGYPSGHTNAGYLAAIAYAYALPERFAEMITRGSQLGENRIVAGMHSPADVIGGRMHAMIVAAYALKNDKSGIAHKAHETAQSYFGNKANLAGMSLYDYAHQKVIEPEGYTFTDAGKEYVRVNVFDNNIYDDHQKNKDLYRFRLTYGMTQDKSKAGQDPIVPEGAEVLLKTRLPYLTTAQRRAVLYTTEVDSGYPILDDSNGWGRIDLVTAADGYGAFLGDVDLVMNVEDGGFSAHDWWQNNISGVGKLSKAGTGQLTLMGDNSYSGGTQVSAGILEAASSTAFGKGDLYLSNGEVKVSAVGALQLHNFTIEAGNVWMKMDKDTTQIDVTKTAYIAGGSLTLDFSDIDLALSEKRFSLVKANTLVGKFDKVTIVAPQGYTVNLEYTDTDVIAQISQ